MKIRLVAEITAADHEKYNRAVKSLGAALADVSINAPLTAEEEQNTGPEVKTTSDGTTVSFQVIKLED